MASDPEFRPIVSGDSDGPCLLNAKSVTGVTVHNQSRDRLRGLKCSGGSPRCMSSLRWVTLTDFLVARSLEILEASSCDYFVAGSRVICNCETLTESVEKVLDDLSLIRACDSVFGPENAIEALLADQYATHPDYDPRWHLLGGAG